MKSNKDTQALTAYLRQAVSDIKTAILQGQYEASKGVNRIQLAVYFGIGKYISQHTRKGVWGTGALETISDQLRRELPGLRGYSATALRNMRKFYENWSALDCNSASALAELQVKDNKGDTNSASALADISSVTTDDFCKIDIYHTILDEKVRKPHENPSIGIVLCKSANREYVEFMIRDYTKPMGVATYKTADEMPEHLRKALPSKEEFAKLMGKEDNDHE
ncbi:MAG: DUF1016 family protein [Bacteroidaceae bacterium]|nr:DUF1016 family protein [Bacteroidaceae bacterium]